MIKKAYFSWIFFPTFGGSLLYLKIKKDKTWYFIILGGPGSEEARGGELKRTFNLSERIFVFFCKANKICVKILKNTKSLKDA